MGTMLENFCCINNQDILENQNYPHSFIGKSKYFQNLSLQKDRLPSNQISLNDYSNEQTLTLSSIVPISTQDVIIQKKGDAFQDYEIIKKMGEGTFGVVYKVKNKNNNTIRAMKVIKKDHLNNLNDSEIGKEIEILKTLNHPYIMKLYEYYVNKGSVVLISELCEEGDLSGKIRKIGKFPEFIVKIIMLQIFKALMYLNQKHIMHGDLKLENILVVCYNNDNNKKKSKNDDGFINAIKHDMNIIMKEQKIRKSLNENIYNKTSDETINVINKKMIEINKKESDFETKSTFTEKRKNEININNNKLSLSFEDNEENIFEEQKFDIFNYGVKLIDFGCSKIMTRYKKQFDDIIGTLVYCSPEVLANNYNESCDIWACGVLMFCLLSGHFPFSGGDTETITGKILSGKFEFDIDYFKNVSDEAKDLIKKCLIYDPGKRITIKEALNHKFFYSLKRSNKFTSEEIKKLKSLKLYNENSKFYQIVFTYLSYNFSDNNFLNHLNNIYYKIDKNCDWKITKGELFQAYKDAGIPITLEEIDKIINLMDFDENGNIDYEEFIRMCIPREQLFTDKNLENAFLLFDKDKKGFITPKEIIDVIQANKILDDDLKKAIKEEILEVADEIIDCNEFKHLMLSLTESEKLKLKST